MYTVYTVDTNYWGKYREKENMNQCIHSLNDLLIS